MPTKLLPTTGTLKENLEQEPDCIDLAYGGEDGGVITFYTISTLLYDEWFAAHSDIYDFKDEFNIENVTEPGIYRDDELYEDGSKKCFTIVVKYDFLAQKLVEEKIKELNEEYDRDFDLKADQHRTVELGGKEIELK